MSSFSNFVVSRVSQGDIQVTFYEQSTATSKMAALILPDPSLIVATTFFLFLFFCYEFFEKIGYESNLGPYVNPFVQGLGII